VFVILFVVFSGVVNVHPSLLPRWRGASPLQFTVLMDDKETGVSLMKILPKQ
jgi:methionyl-tRNA formyltransferase